MKKCKKCGLVAFEEEEVCRGCGLRSFDSIEKNAVGLAEAVAYVKVVDKDAAFERDKCLAVLADLVPHLEAERNMLAIAFNCGAVGFLARGDASSALRLMDQAYLSPSISNMIVAAYTGNAALNQSDSGFDSIPTVSSLRERGLLFLEAGEAKKASSYFERALDIDPHDAMSYLGKMMVAQGASSLSELAACNFDTSTPDFSFALRFAKGDERALVEKIRDSVDQVRAVAVTCEEARELISRGDIASYEQAISALEQFKNDGKAKILLESTQSKLEAFKATQTLIAKGTVADLMEAIGELDSIQDLKEAAELLTDAKSKLKSYEDACALIKESTIVDLERAIEKLEPLENFEEARQALEDAKRKVGRFEDAQALVAKGVASDWEEALVILGQIQNLKEASELFSRIHAELLMLEDAQKLVADNTIAGLHAAISHLSSITGLKDADVLLEEIEFTLKAYEDAQTLIARGAAADLETASEILGTLRGFEDTDALLEDIAMTLEAYEEVQALVTGGTETDMKKAVAILQSINNPAAKKQLLDLARVLVGSNLKIKMGVWGEEIIEWRILDVQDDSLLLITERAVDCGPYNGEDKSNIWEHCALRSWLNGAFLQGAFTDEERARIVQTSIVDDYDTADKLLFLDFIFCLSADEAKEYFSDDVDRVCYPTRWAKENGIWISDSNHACHWWLRSEGHDQNSAAINNSNGIVNEFGWSVDRDSIGIRPALWMHL